MFFHKTSHRVEPTGLFEDNERLRWNSNTSTKTRTKQAFNKLSQYYNLQSFLSKKQNYIRASTQERCRGCSGNDEQIATEFDWTSIHIQHQFLSNNVAQEMIPLHTGETVCFKRSIKLCKHRCQMPELLLSESFISWICYFSISVVHKLQHKQIVMAMSWLPWIHISVHLSLQ